MTLKSFTLGLSVSLVVTTGALAQDTTGTIEGGVTDKT
jgi:hypothetical protein